MYNKNMAFHTNIEMTINFFYLYRTRYFHFYASVAQWVTCLATDVSLTAEPGVTSLIPAQSHTFVEIDHEKKFYGHSPPFP